MKKNKKFPSSIGKKAFNKKLQERDFEDLKLINSIEKHFIDRRGYVFRMPKPGESVILLYSGGLDSTIAWAHLIEQYKLHVYPLILTKNWNPGQRKSIYYFKKYFKFKYANYYHKPFIIKNSFLTPKIFKHINNLKKIHPEYFLNNLILEQKEVTTLSGLSALSPTFGIIYMKYLEMKYNINTKTIFLAVLSGDGTAIPTQSYTYLRKTLLFLDDFISSENLQIVSIFFEKELGLFCEKKDIIKLGSKFGLPLEKTYSCYKNKLFNCGSCLACYSRRLEFKKANIVDKTLYYDKLFIVKSFDKISQFLIYYKCKGIKICKNIKLQLAKKF